MANITGTNGKDTLTGTAENDAIAGLGGNDRIIASNGNDVIDGGTGNDLLDYSSFGADIGFYLTGTANISKSINTTVPINRDEIVNIETIVANPDRRNVLYGVSATFDDDPFPLFFPKILTTMDVDLSTNRLTYSIEAGANQTITLKNFNNVFAGSGNDRIKGNDLDNNIYGGLGNDMIIGSKGNDTINGGGDRAPSQPRPENNTVDYSNLGRTTKIILAGDYSLSGSREMKIDKSDFGVDTVKVGTERIIGANDRDNTIDTSGLLVDRQLNINLANNFLKVTVPGSRFSPTITDTYEVINFVNVVGSKYNDTIIGSNKKGKLTGGAGNDTITGGSKNDRITGSDRTARGVGEVDTLTGGGGRDKFILGDKGGAYYVGTGNNDYALITDFDLFKDSISIGSLKDYSFAIEATNTINLYSGKDVNTRDLIAKIQITGGISSIASNSRSVMGYDSNLNALIGKIDILAGPESVGESLLEMQDS